MFLKVMVNKQVNSIQCDCPNKSRNTAAPISPNFTQSFGQGANSAKGTTKPGNAGGK